MCVWWEGGGTYVIQNSKKLPWFQVLLALEANAPTIELPRFIIQVIKLLCPSVPNDDNTTVHQICKYKYFHP